MADNPEKNETTEAKSTPPAKSGGKIVLVGFISAMMVVETALFFFLVPSAEEVAALAEARLVQNIQQGESNEEQKQEDENKIEEFELGMFGETFSPIDTEAKYRIEFTLFGLVKAKDKPILEKEFSAKAGRIRHAIRMKVRNSEIGELEENQLGLLQRRILATCNHLLDSELLVSVGFTDYQVFQE